MNRLDVFPAASDIVPEGDHNGYGWRMIPCKLCGALVVPSGEAAHIGFHASMKRFLKLEGRP